MARRKNIFAPSESLIQAAVLQHWLSLGEPNTLVFAIPNANAHGQPGLTPGVADLCVLAPGLPVAFIELKRDVNSKATDEQIAFHMLCRNLGIRHVFCVGRDEPVRMLEAWGVVKRAAA